MKSKRLFSFLETHQNTLLLSLFFILSFIFFQSTFWYQDQTFFIKSKLWSDFAAHIPLVRSFSMGENFPPEYPMFSGERIQYHFLFYFLVAVFEKAGLNIALSLNIFSALGFSFLLLMIFLFGKHLFSFRAGVIALFLFLFNGSFVFVEFFKKYPLQEYSFFPMLIEQRNFISFGPWDGNIISAFWNLNIFTNQRHLAMGIALFLFLVYLCEQKIKNPQKSFSLKEKIFFFLGLMLLPLLHQASYAAFVVYGIIIFLRFWHTVSWKTWLFFIFSGALSLLIYRFFESSFVPTFDWGFLAKEKTFQGIFQYWIFNFGLYVFFFPFLFWKTPSSYKNLYFTATVLFIVAHLFRFSPDMINNHKFVTLFLIIMNIGVAGLLDSTYRNGGFWKKVGVIATFFLLTFSGVIDLFPILNDKLVVQKDLSQSELGNWVTTTDPHSVFFVNDYLYNPVSLAGRKLYLDYGYFAWSMGYPDKERRENTPLFFRKDISKEDWCSLVKKEKIDYFVLDIENTSFEKDYGMLSSSLLQFSSPAKYDQKIAVFSVKEICL